MQQAAECLDPEHSRERAVRLGDAAILALLSALLGRAVVKGAALADEQRSLAIQVAVLAVGALLALVTALYLRRRPGNRARLAAIPSTGIGLAIGGAAGWALRGQSAPFPFELAVAGLPSILGEELIFRGTLQRALEERWPGWRFAAAAVAAAIAFLATPGPWPFVLAGAVVVSALRAATGRTAPGFLARAAFVLLLAVP
jgi:membrane protease YdiL (CAAX protease family)